MDETTASNEVLLSGDGVAHLGRLISGAIAVAGVLRTRRLAGDEKLICLLEESAVLMLDQLGSRSHGELRDRVIGRWIARSVA